MRIHGTLTKWNDDRGFGFISQPQRAGDIFVHISAFPRGERPKLNELVSFETEIGPNGKARAINVMRPGQRPTARATRNDARASSGRLGGAVTFMAIIGVGVYAYLHRSAPTTSTDAAPSITMPVAPESNFSCDGRTMCSQMSSCAEATYFLRNCPGVKMDGDSDGVPCEQQFCN